MDLLFCMLDQVTLYSILSHSNLFGNVRLWYGLIDFFFLSINNVDKPMYGINLIYDKSFCRAVISSMILITIHCA